MMQMSRTWEFPLVGDIALGNQIGVSEVRGCTALHLAPVLLQRIVAFLLEGLVSVGGQQLIGELDVGEFGGCGAVGTHWHSCWWRGWSLCQFCGCTAVRTIAISAGGVLSTRIGVGEVGSHTVIHAARGPQ